jgi:hypothetical protein
MIKTRAGIVSASTGLLVACIASLLWMTSKPAAPPGETPPLEHGAQARVQPSSSESSRLTSAIAALTQSIAALQQRVERIEDIKELPDDQPAANTPEARQRSSTEQKAEALERLDTIEESFRSEPRDQVWAKEMESTLHQAFVAGNFQGTRALETDCKATFCRMAVEHDTPESSLQFELIKRQLPGSYYIQHLDPDANGHSKSVAFFLRRGAERENVIAQLMSSPRQRAPAE